MRKLEASIYASARTLDEYNASIKKAFEAGRAQGSFFFGMLLLITVKAASQRQPRCLVLPMPLRHKCKRSSIASPSKVLSRRCLTPWQCHSLLHLSQQPALVLECQAFLTPYVSIPAVPTAPPPTVASVAGSSVPIAFPTYGVAKPVASALPGQFNKLPPKPAAHPTPMKPAGVGYQPPPVVHAPPPTVVTVPVTVGTTGLTQAELLADEKCWQKLEQMRAKFEAPLRTIHETLQKSGRDDSNVVPVQKMVRFLASPVMWL